MLYFMKLRSDQHSGEWRNGRRAGFRCQCPFGTWGFKSPFAHKMRGPGINPGLLAYSGPLSSWYLRVEYGTHRTGFGGPRGPLWDFLAFGGGTEMSTGVLAGVFYPIARRDCRNL